MSIRLRVEFKQNRRVSVGPICLFVALVFHNCQNSLAFNLNWIKVSVARVICDWVNVNMAIHEWQTDG